MTNNTTPVKPDETKGPVANNPKGTEDHNKAAMHHEEAAKHHLDAAKHLKDGNSDKAHASSLKANEQHAELGKSTIARK